MRLINQENCLDVIAEVLAAERAARECDCPACLDERFTLASEEAELCEA
ncbi:MAG: hypothetical protein K2X38_21935 [Gemmataceae bacterium]|nr:hypothetical protein [Gemmataceae bacterium]